MSLLDQVRKLEQEVRDRLKELEPLTREYEQLRKVAERLGLKDSEKPAEAEAEPQASTVARRGAARTGAGERSAPTRAKRRAKRSAARKRAAKPAAKPSGARATSARRAASARPGQRQDEVLRLVGEHPGITVRELGGRLGVDSTGLYRVVKRLTDEGRVRKDGPRLHPAGAPKAPARQAEATDASEAAAETTAQAPAGTEPAESKS
jgi:ribosomal protein S25